MATKRWPHLGAGLLAALALTGASAGARAEWEPISQRTAAGVDMYWWSSSFYGSALPIIPFVQLDVTRSVFLAMQFPIVLSIDGPPDNARDSGKSRAGLGNPTFGVHYADTSGKLSYYLGGRVSAPLGAVQDDDWQFSDTMGAVSLAGYDHHLFAVDYLPVTGAFGLEIQPVRPLWIRIALDPILLVKLSRGPADDRNGAVFGIQQRFEVAGRAEMGVGGGVALQMVAQLTRSGGALGLLPDEDRVQAAIEPFFLFDRGALFLRVGVLVALDKPLGFGFDEPSFFSPYPKVATGHFQIGGRF